jgi:hypothetical protein
MIEHMELAGLVDVARTGGPRYFLSLHDVLLCPDDASEAEADRHERALIERFDGVITSSAEDQRLLGATASCLVANGFVDDSVSTYVPSSGRRSVLFVGPFRASINGKASRDSPRSSIPASNCWSRA